MKDKLQSALGELAETFGLDDLVLSGAGEVALEIDDVEIGITWMEDLQAVHLLGIVGEMPDVTGPELGKVILSANHMAVMTGGAAIGYDFDSNVLTLNWCLPTENITGPVLAQALQVMANVTAGWRGNLPVLRDMDAAADPAPPPAQGEGEWLRM